MVIPRQFRIPVLRWLSRPLNNDSPPGYRVVILKCDRIGDFCLSTGVIRRFIDEFGYEDCCLVLSEAVVDLARAEFPRVRIVGLPAIPGGRILRFFFRILKIRRLLVDATGEKLVCLRTESDEMHSLMLSVLNPSESYIYTPSRELDGSTGEAMIEFTPTHPVVSPEGKDLPFSSGETLFCREITRFCSLFEAVTGKAIEPDEIMPSFTQESTRKGDYILVAPFSSTSIKDYPQLKLLDFLRKILSLSSCPFELTGSAEQKTSLKQLRNALPPALKKRVLVRTHGNLRSFIKHVAHSGMLISMDSAGAHMATAMDKPCLVLLGGGHYGWFGPWRKSSRQIWVTYPMDCFNCGWHCIHPEPYCLTNISTGQLTDAFRSLADIAGFRISS